METSSRIGTILQRVGDADVLANGGGFVIEWREPDGTVTHELEWIEPPVEDATLFTVYRVPLPWTLLEETTQSFGWRVWSQAATTSGITSRELRDCAMSNFAPDRASAVQILAAHLGYAEFDQEPLALTRAEVVTRWADEFATEDDDE